MATETQPEITDQELRDIAAQLDAGSVSPEDEVELTPDATAGQDKKEAEGSVSPEAKTEVTQASQESSQQEPARDLDYKAEYERIKKDYERQDRSWKRLNEEKEALAKLKATTRVDETRIAGDQFSAEEYEMYAEKAIEEGGPDAVRTARQAMTRAKQIRQQAMMDRWQSSIKEAIDEDPDLADQESGLAKAVQEVLRDPSWGSFKQAVRLAKSKQLADSIPGLKGEIENYKKEIERLNKAMEVGGKPGLPKREGSKKFEEMDLKEQAAYLRRRAEEADDS